MLVSGSEVISISSLRRDSLSSPSEVAMTTVDVFYLRFTSTEENVKSIYF